MPWLLVAIAAFANEFYDYSQMEAPQDRKISFGEEATSDIWNTLLLPTLFLLIARFWPEWLTGKAGKEKE
ncbi:hypothetical protein [Sphingorhabdus sp. SMR4y]|uniref:hypothetical protein n=1 Tax=Sphingorhabdus sp. SMR4y TaxID=2584094 RepID=UPI0011AB3DD7|nr:hypothetical protein [Sphingorhabdus sp. SMR4y]